MTTEEVYLNSVDSDGEKQKTGFVDISALDLYHLLQFFITILSEKTWQHIGLHIDPSIGEVKKDFERAHVAIDCIISLVDKLESHVTEDETNRLRSLITDLQINYAHQVEAKGK